jgi:hypothetical protein
VAYEFKRGKRRTIGLSVSPDGLSVSAPRWTPVGEVEALLHDKSAWVLEKLQSAHERAGDLARELAPGRPKPDRPLGGSNPRSGGAPGSRQRREHARGPYSPSGTAARLSARRRSA